MCVGPVLRLRHDAVIAVTGAPSAPTLDGQPLAMWQSHAVRAGSVLRGSYPAHSLIAGNPAVVSLDTLDIDLGTSRLRASGQLAVASAEDVTGKAEVRMTGLDALMRALGKVPEAAMATPVMLMLKGMGEQKGAETVWRVTYAANKVLVNGQDLSALLSGGN